VLHLLVLGVAHDRLRFGVRLDSEPLLIPADRLRFFDEGSDHAREGACLRRKLLGRLVVLVESHGVVVE
jgi:hypothetical protein